MRNVGLALPLSLLLLGGCRSTPDADDAPADLPEESAAEMDAAQAGAQETAEGDDELAQDVRDLSLREQRRQLLVQAHVDKALQFREDLHLDEAMRELQQAFELDPDNLQVKRLMAEVGALMGRAPGEATTLSQQVRDEYEIRVQQMRANAEDNLRRGKLALSRGDYDAAIAEFSLALNHIRWAPYSIEWGGIDEEAAELLAAARAQRGAALEAQRGEAQRRAVQDLREAEALEQARREALVANLMTEAIEAYERGEYDEAMNLAEQVLRRDARHEQAEELRDAAFRSGRESVRREYIAEKREQFARWKEQIDEMRIPWTSVLTLPDIDHWRSITELRKTRRGLDLTQAISAEDVALRQALRENRVVLPGIQEEELTPVIELIRQFTGLPLVVDPAAEEAAINAGAVFQFNLENRMTVEDVLNLIVKPLDDVVWTIRHDAVLITTREKARGEPLIRHHDVQDLVFGLTNFTGPRIDRIRLLDELEDEDGGGPFGGILEDAVPVIEVGRLLDLIQENIEPESWQDDGVRIEATEGGIVIVHSADVQRQVRDFLEDLRRFNASLVTIESKFMTVGQNWLQEIGVDFRGLDGIDITDVTTGLEDMASQGLDNSGTGSEGQGAAAPPAAGFFYDDGEDGDFRASSENFFEDPLGNALSTIGGMTVQLTFLNDLELSAILRAVEKTSQFELVNSQILSVHNTQRAYVTVINQQAYIQDFDVEVAQFQAVADPQINVLHEGVVLDVRPTIHHDRRYLTLEIQPTVARVVALRDFSTTLGGNTSPVEFQLPELEVQSVNTSAVIPDGGSILLGGLSNIRNIERRAEVPWLGRIPLLGFLFKQEGYNDEKKTLMILIRARISDVRESVTQRLERHF